MTIKVSEEAVYRIWNDETGERMEVGEDGDGLNLVEIRQITSDGKVEARLTFLPEYLEPLIKALQKKKEDSSKTT